MTENEVAQAEGREKLQSLKSLFAKILAKRFSLKEEAISQLFKTNEFSGNAALEEAIRRTGRQDITFAIVPNQWRNEINVTFTIDTDGKAEKQLFEFGAQ